MNGCFGCSRLRRRTRSGSKAASLACVCLLVSGWGCDVPAQTEAVARSGGRASHAVAAAPEREAQVGVDLEPDRDADGTLVPLDLTAEAWSERLSKDAYRILRAHQTERPFTSSLLTEEQPGVYACAGCGLALFTSVNKFDSGTGWPSFTRPIADHVSDQPDLSYGMTRIENRCGRCDGHLGHVFDDGPPPSGLRYCINGLALRFVPEPSLAASTSSGM